MDKQHRADAIQKSIIEASTDMFLKHTANKTGVDEVAAAARVSKATLYKYFQDKNGLCLSVYAHVADELSRDIARQLSGEIPIVQKMTNYINIYTAFIGSGYLGMCEELSVLNADVRKRFGLLQAEGEKLLLHLIAEAKEQGFIDTGIDDAVIFHYINMGLSYFRYNERYRGIMQNDERFRQAFMALVFQGILSDPSAFL